MSTNPEAPRNPDAIRDAIQRQRGSIDGKNIFKTTAEESQKLRGDTEQLQKQLTDSIRGTEQAALDEVVNKQNFMNHLLVPGGIIPGNNLHWSARLALAPTGLTGFAGVVPAAYSYFNRTSIENHIDQRNKELLLRYGVRMEVIFGEAGTYQVRVEPVPQQNQEGDIFQSLRPNNPNRQQTIQRLTVDAQIATSELAGLLMNYQRFTPGTLVSPTELGRALQQSVALVNSPAIMAILGSMQGALQSIGRVDSNFMVDLFRQMNQWLEASGAGYYFGASNPLTLQRNAVQPAPGGQGGDVAGQRPQDMDINQMTPVQRQEYLRVREQQIVDRVGELVQALNTQGPTSPQVEAIRAELHTWLQTMDRVDPNAGSLAFFAMNDRIWHTGFRFTTNPQHTELRLETRVPNGRGSREDVLSSLDSTGRRVFLERQQSFIVNRTGDLARALNTQGPPSPRVQAIRAELHTWLQTLDRVDPNAGSLAFFAMNDRLLQTAYRLTTNPQHTELRLETRVPNGREI